MQPYEVWVREPLDVRGEEGTEGEHVYEEEGKAFEGTRRRRDEARDREENFMGF